MCLVCRINKETMHAGFCTTFNGQSQRQKHHTPRRHSSYTSTTHPDVPDIKYFIKVILVGDPSVGKTSLIRKYCKCSLCLCEQTIRKRSLASMEFHNKVVNVEGSNVQLRIQDTAGEERYRSITPSYYRGAHGCLLLFDTTKIQTFNNISNWAEDVKLYSLHPENLVKILVGTKSKDHQKREVTQEKAQELANNLDLQYMEVSLEENFNISELFEKLTKEVVKTFQRSPKVYTDIKTESVTLSKTAVQGPKKKEFKCSC